MSVNPMEAPRCKATAKQTGQRCKRRPIPGGAVCVMHGGASPQARRAAEQRQAEALATSMMLAWDPEAVPVTDPIAALQRLGGQTLRALDVLGARVSTESLDGATAVAWLRVMREGRQMLEGLQRLGLEERQLQISEQTGQMLAAVVRAILDRLGLDEQQQTIALQVVPEEFRRLREPAEQVKPVVRGELG